MSHRAELNWSRRRGLSLVAGLSVGIPVALFVLLSTIPRLDVYFESYNFHLILVSVIAAFAAGVAILAALAAAGSKEASLVFLALGCVAVGAGLLGHGLTTPGVAGIDSNFWVGRLPTVAITVFALCQAAAVLRPKRAPARFASRHPWFALALPTVLMLGAITWIVMEPTRGFGARLFPAEELLTDWLRLSSAVVLVVLGLVHWRRWRLSNDSVQLALVLASVMTAEAIASMHFGQLWHLSWWDYHAFLLVGFGSAVYAVITGFIRAQGREQGLAHVFKRSALDHISHGYPEALNALVAAVEARDSYTRGHSKRVTGISLAIGQQIGLSSDKLRQLVWGAELHDIGKIGIPDYVLQKEGPLTPEERALVEQHPVIGWEIAQQARSLKEVLDVVRHHHERIDGTGYPDNLAEGAIPLLARIVAVADVWDALTSDRSYRPAWPRGRALEIMAQGRGTQFDSQCHDAFMKIVDDLPDTGGPPGDDQSEHRPSGAGPTRRRRHASEAAHHAPGASGRASI